MATQKEVAERAGVSFITVSRVINKKGNVKPETRDRVLQAIKELNYYPNSFAQGLNADRVSTIAVVPYLSTSTGLEETSYYRRLLVGIERYCIEAGFDILLSTQRGEENCFDFLRPFYQRKADGVILLGVDREQLDLRRIEEDSIPCVVVGERLLGRNIFWLDSDNRWGARLLTEYLINRGHRKIAYLHADRWNQDTEDRLESFREVMEERGLPFPGRYFFKGDFSMDAGRTTARQIASMKDRPTAIISATDYMALGILEEAARLGFRVPQDLSIAGFDGHEITAFTQPALATVVQDLEGMGWEAARILTDQIAKKTPQNHKRIFPVVFEPRGSICDLSTD